MNVPRICADCVRSNNCHHDKHEGEVCHYRCSNAKFAKERREYMPVLHEAIFQHYNNTRREYMVPGLK